MRLLHQRIQILQCAEQRMHTGIVRDVIAEVRHRRGIDGREPERINAKPAQVVQLLRDTGKVSNTVTIAILKTTRVDLVNDPGLPPGCSLCHIFFVHVLYLRYTVTQSSSGQEVPAYLSLKLLYLENDPFFPTQPQEC